MRRFVCLEPRGAVNQTVNLMIPTCDPSADAGFIVLQADEAHPMSGANTMCVATARVETGMTGIKDDTVFPVTEFPKINLIESYLEYHLRGIVTKKGLSALNKYIDQSTP